MFLLVVAIPILLLLGFWIYNQKLKKEQKRLREAAGSLNPKPLPPTYARLYDWFDGRPLAEEGAEVIRYRGMHLVVSKEHAEMIRQGKAPKLRVCKVGQNYVHWSQDPSFQPEQDAMKYEESHHQNYLNHGIHWVDLWMYDYLFRHPTYYGGGYYNSSQPWSKPPVPFNAEGVTFQSVEGPPIQEEETAGVNFMDKIASDPATEAPFSEENSTDKS